jgi:glutamate racemase
MKNNLFTFLKQINRIFFVTALCITLFTGLATSQVNCDSLARFTSKDSVYRISFDDSGVGGLIFALDVLEEIAPKLKDLESKYKVRFIVQHVGDSENAPYGSKTPAEIKKLTLNLISYTADLPHTKSLIIACNTASTVYDKEMEAYFKSRYPLLNIIAMINKSSNEIADMAEKYTPDKKNLYIALLATPATIKSKSYQTQITNIAKAKNENLKIYAYSPQTWVSNIEKGVEKKQVELDVLNDLKIFKEQMGDDFQKVSVAGLFCTHYPFYRNEIKTFFNENGNKEIEVLTQGQIFSDDIFTDVVQNIQKDSLDYPRRATLVPSNCINEIEILSDNTGGNINEMKNAINSTHPQYSERVVFKVIKLN